MNERAETPPDATRLVVAYAFPPYSDTSSIVAGKRVRTWGEPVDLLQAELDQLRPLDPTLDRIPGELVRRRQVLATRQAFSGWVAITEFCQEGLGVLEAWEDERGRPYESIYSRAHFVASHFLAARYAASRPATIWRAEFSDPLSHDAQGRVRHAPVRSNQLFEFCETTLRERGFDTPASDNVYEWCEWLTYAVADELIFTNAAQRDYMITRCAEPRLAAEILRKAVVDPQPTLPSTFYQMADPDYPLAPGKVHIGYFGNFYATRHARTLLDALAGLDQEDQERLHLHVFTSKTEALLHDVEALALTDAVSINQLAPYLEFLALTQRMDVLMAIDATTPANAAENPFLLSKWSDYIGSGTPAWGMVAERSELSKQALAYRSPTNHVTAAQQVLVSLARDGVNARPPR